MLLFPLIGTAVHAESISYTVTVVAPPEVMSVSVHPDSVMIYPCPATTQITVTATVFHPNSINQIESVEITTISPAIPGVSTPIVMTPETEGDIQATYTATIDLPCCTPRGGYTLEVAATDKYGSEDTGSTEFNVEATVAIRATDMNFGTIAPGESSTASTTVTCTGNAEIEFVDQLSPGYDNPEDNDGITWSDMTSGLHSIADDNIETSWDNSTTIACGNSVDAEFTLSVPYGTPPGTYTGMATFTATAVFLREV
jgi:hypothetical protein